MADQNDWDPIRGKLIVFANPGVDLLPIDRLEVFDPNGRWFIRGGWWGRV